MATHDYVIANGTGAAVRSDLNNALAAIVSNNSSSSEPSTKYAYQWWADTTTGQLKLRNSANNAWVTIFELDGTMLMEDGTVSAPGLAFASDLNTGFFRSAADKINFATGGVERLEIGSSEVVFNDGSNDVDFRVESNGNTHMLFVDGGNDRVGIGGTPAYTLDVHGTDASLRLKGTSNTGFIADQASNGLVSLINYDSGVDLRLGTAGAEKVRILSSGGITFNGDTAAANALDDYEEGTWSPTLTLGTATASDAKYTKIGRRVNVSAAFNAFSDRSTVSAIRVSSLPFNNADPEAAGSMFGRYIAITASTTYVHQNTVWFYRVSSTNFTELQHHHLTSSDSAMYFQATYTVA